MFLNTEYWALMKFFTRKRLSAAETTKALTNVDGEFAPSYHTDAKWVAEFKDPTWAFEDAPRSDQSPTTLTDESVQAIH